MARIRSLLTLGLAMAAVAAPPALGTGWTELPSPANPAGWMGTPSIDASPDGHAAAAWSGYTGSAFPVVAVARAPGTGWGEPTVLVSGSSVVNPPVVVVDPSGRTVAAWTRCASGTWRVEAAQRPPGGEWGTPVVLATSSCLRTDTQAFATVDAAGHVVLAWTSSEPFRLATASSGPDGTWTTPVSLSPDAVGPSVGLAATGDGGVLAAWTLESGSGAVQVATRDAQGAWGAPATITSTTASRRDATLSLAGDGRAVLAWIEGGWSDARAWTAARAPGGTWGAPAVASGSATGLYRLAAAAGAPDRAVVAWAGNAGHGAADGATGALGAPATPDAAGRTVQSVAAGFAPDGTPLVAWSDGQRTGVTAHDGTWGTGTLLPPADAAAGIPVMRQVAGATLVARAQGPSSSFGFVIGAGLRVSVLDDRPPVLRVAPPPSAVAGEPVALSAEAGDAWSPVGEVDWDLGDSSTTGDTVSHVYAAPGVHTVTARVADSAGNVAETSFDLTVVAPPAATPEPPAAPAPATPAPTPRSSPRPVATPRAVGPAALPVRRGGVSVAVACGTARCSGRVALTAAGRVLASGPFSAGPGRRAAVALRLGASDRRALAPRTRATLTVRERAAGAWRVTARRAVTLVAPRP